MSKCSLNKIIFRADGGSKIGMGHFVRSLALAEMLSDEYYCIFATQSPSEYQQKEVNEICKELISLPSDKTHFEYFLSILNGEEIVVLDNYYFTTGYQQSIKAKGCKLVCIDDIHDKHYVADIVINHAPLSSEKFSIEAYSKLLLGFDYSLLRKSFHKNSKSTSIPEELKHLLICFGGADFNNLTCKTLLSLYKSLSIEKITVIVGNGYMFEKELQQVIQQSPNSISITLLKSIDSDEMVATIRGADVAIVPCSTVLYEVLSQNVPAITGFYVDNQTEIAASLKGRYHNVLVIGDLNVEPITPDVIDRLYADIKNRSFTPLINSNIQKKLTKEFKALVAERDYSIRFANKFDVDTYFHWANDCDVRQNALSTDEIEYDSHVVWFKKRIESSKSFLFIIEKGEKPVGQVRFDMVNNYFEIDYSVDNRFRGKGLGKLILKLAIEQLTKDIFKDNNKYLKAIVNENNFASYSVFRKLNFKETKKEIIQSKLFFVFEKSF